jgi:hypothetical protein
MPVKVQGSATKTLINKAVRMLKNGQKEYVADYGYTNINVYENRDGTKFASISTTKRIKIGPDRYQDVAGYQATVEIVKK